MHAWALVSSVGLKVLQLVGAVGIVSAGGAVVVVVVVRVLVADVVLAPVAKVYW